MARQQTCNGTTAVQAKAFRRGQWAKVTGPGSFDSYQSEGQTKVCDEALDKSRRDIPPVGGGANLGRSAPAC